MKSSQRNSVCMEEWLAQRPPVLHTREDVGSPTEGIVVPFPRRENTEHHRRNAI